MVVGSARVRVVVRGGELRVGDQVILREAPEWRGYRRSDGCLAVGKAITAIAENSAANIGERRIERQEARSGIAACVRIDEGRDVVVIALRELRGEAATQMSRARLEYLIRRATILAKPRGRRSCRLI